MTLNEIFDHIRRMTLKMALAGKKTPEINEAIAVFLSQNGLKDEMLPYIQQQAQELWISQYTLPENERKIAQKLVKKAGNQFAVVDNAVRQSVVDVLIEHRKKNYPKNILEGRLVEVLDGKKHWAKSVAITAKASFANACNWHQGINAGLEKVRYDGPGAQRPFCIEHLGKIYTIDEINKMDNGQGLPVRYYCGGWRCRHHLTFIE